MATPLHVLRYEFQGKTILLKYTDGVMMPSPFSRFLAEHLPPPETGTDDPWALDLGSGTGIQSVILAKLGWKTVYAVDIDKRCLGATEFNALLNEVSEYKPGSQSQIVAVHSNIFEKIKGLKFDLIVSNPPTLPSTDETPTFSAGGADGRDFLESMIQHSVEALKPRGQLLFVQSSLPGLDLTVKSLAKIGFSVDIVAKRKQTFRDHYMPHLFFYRRRQMLTDEELYFEDPADGGLFEWLYIIKAKKT
jgi:release factor glutamine methyltransferase